MLRQSTSVRCVLLSLLALFLIIGVWGCWVPKPKDKNKTEAPQQTEHPSVVVPQPTGDVVSVQSAMERGAYEQASEQILRLQQAGKDPKSPEMQRLISPLKVEMEFHYSRSRRKSSETETILTPDNPYWLIVKIFESCYLYIVQRDSAGRLQQLFPNRDFSPISNPVESGTIRLPGSYDQFHLDDTPGTETIYILAARWQQKELERWLENGQGSTNQVLELMEKANQYPASIGGGLAYKSQSFQHASASPGPR